MTDSGSEVKGCAACCLARASPKPIYGHVIVDDRWTDYLTSLCLQDGHELV